jgi:hypothetical protein
MKNQQMVKLFLSLFVCTFVIFGSSYFGPKALGVSKKETVQKTAFVNEKKPAIVPAATEQVVTISSTSVNIKEIPDDLQSFLSARPKIEIPAQSPFSFIAFLDKQQLESTSSETLSIIATGIYQTILPTNFTIDERNISNELPDFAQLGDEAKVDVAQNMDLAFTNPNSSNYSLQFQLDGNVLTVTLKGAKLPNEYKIVKENQQKLLPKTIMQYSPYLSPGQIQVTDPGKSGETIDVYRETYRGESINNSELIANDYYPPQNRVEVHALDQPTAQAGSTTDTTGNSNQQTTTNSQSQSDQTGQQTTTDGTSSGTTTTNGTTTPNGTTTSSTDVNTTWGS